VVRAVRAVWAVWAVWAVVGGVGLMGRRAQRWVHPPPGPQRPQQQHGGGCRRTRAGMHAHTCVRCSRLDTRPPSRSSCGWGGSRRRTGVRERPQQTSRPTSRRARPAMPARQARQPAPHLQQRRDLLHQARRLLQQRLRVLDRRGRRLGGCKDLVDALLLHLARQPRHDVHQVVQRDALRVAGRWCGGGGGVVGGGWWSWPGNAGTAVRARCERRRAPVAGRMLLAPRPARLPARPPTGRTCWPWMWPLLHTTAASLSQPGSSGRAVYGWMGSCGVMSTWGEGRGGGWRLVMGGGELEQGWGGGQGWAGQAGGGAAC
jgi:hypothetical protein